MGRKREQRAAAHQAYCEHEDDDDDDDDDGYYQDFRRVDISERRGLLPPTPPPPPLDDHQQRGKNKQPKISLRRKLQDLRLRELLEHPGNAPHRRKDDWMRPYWLGLGLFLVLFPFWLLDSLKDPVFGALIGGNLQLHLPKAKLLSVCMTLALVIFLEHVALEARGGSNDNNNERADEVERSREDVMDGGGTWNRMGIAVALPRQQQPQLQDDATTGGRRYNWDPQSPSDEGADTGDRVPSHIFASIGVPYSIFFGMMAYLLQFNPATAWTAGSARSNDDAASSNSSSSSNSSQAWLVLGYFLYAAIESFGSLAVATFWSYTNSTLALEDAEAYYGTIIAFAQMGAIAGSTMVTMHVWNSITLFIVACLVILLHIIVMTSYSRRFPPTSNVPVAERGVSAHAPAESAAADADEEATVWSGIHLILNHNYVLLILGVSCLYEVSLTCLNYQMTLLGWNRFEDTPNYDPDESNSSFGSNNFTQFMGRYGQMVNVSSLVLSSLIFPLLIHRVGLKYTLRLFPTLLLVANIVAFGALPGNLAVLFFSISLLKAMTYSIHDPAKEILYIPTSNAIKFKAKFWIDVVGARFAKAIGSSINHYSGSVHRSIRVASAPSLLTAAALWYVCYRVGTQFEDLVESGTIVGLDGDDPPRTNHNNMESFGEYDENDDDCGNVQETQESMELTLL